MNSQKKKIIIPTDFSVASLQLIDYAILNFPNTALDIVLVCGFTTPDSKWGLTNFTPEQEIKRLQCTGFEKVKDNLLVENSQWIQTISTELYTGTTNTAFQNFCEILGITDALVPCKNFLSFQAAKCFDPTTAIKENFTNTVSVVIEPTFNRTKTSLSNSNILNL